MIYDKLSALARYRGLSKHLDMGIDFLRSTDLNALPLGRTEILGDDVYCNHFAYATEPISPASLFEAHVRYLDLHIILSGCEQVALAPVEALTEVEVRSDEDAIMYRGEAEHAITLEPGRFLLVYPGEGHLPKLAPKDPMDVDKLVLKIAIEKRT